MSTLLSAELKKQSLLQFLLWVVRCSMITEHEVKTTSLRSTEDYVSVELLDTLRNSLTWGVTGRYHQGYRCAKVNYTNLSLIS